jgi:hypothetical protein
VRRWGSKLLAKDQEQLGRAKVDPFIVSTRGSALANAQESDNPDLLALKARLQHLILRRKDYCLASRFDIGHALAQ